MQIIAGLCKGRKLTAPTGRTTRPTAQRVRQALFDMLVHAPWGGSVLFENTSILDAFAGTGALGLEALSRGAGSCNFFENDPEAFTVLKQNIALCKMQQKTRINSFSFLNAQPPSYPCKLVFLDPPYHHNLPRQACTLLVHQKWIHEESIIVIETSKKEALLFENNTPLAVRSHGAATLSIWQGHTVLDYIRKNPGGAHLPLHIQKK